MTSEKALIEECCRHLGCHMGIGTMLYGAQSSLRQLLVLKNEAVVMGLARSCWLSSDS